ncbi:MAG: hypothetical protein GY708_12895 [Actinomycetia bacterium]|nr:hypothetical protein [Actinomycetes bacterium]MCP4961561.1 hypothetical protein [Actinomycetes bacterium]
MNQIENVSELLSAYMDNELDDHERRRVDEALTLDEALVDELRSMRQIREAVRDLPLLDIPDEFAQRLERRSPFGPVARPRRRTRTRAGALSALVSVAFWGVLVGTGSSTEVLPDLAGVVAFHTDGSESGTEIDPSAVDAMPMSADGFSLVEASRSEGVDQYLYSNGVDDVAVMVQRGRVDWDGLPIGSRLDVEDGAGWLGDIDGRHVLVVGRGDSVYLVTGSVVDDMFVVSNAMPETERSLGDRIVDASRELVDLVGVQP